MLLSLSLSLTSLSLLRYSAAYEYWNSIIPYVSLSQAKVVIWDYKERAELGSYCVHREEVAAVAVSAGEEIVVSLGGPLDGYLVVWHVESKKPLCSMLFVALSCFLEFGR